MFPFKIFWQDYQCIRAEENRKESYIKYVDIAKQTKTTIFAGFVGEMPTSSTCILTGLNFSLLDLIHSKPVFRHQFGVSTVSWDHLEVWHRAECQLYIGDNPAEKEKEWTEMIPTIQSNQDSGHSILHKL